MITSWPSGPINQDVQQFTVTPAWSWLVTPPIIDPPDVPGIEAQQPNTQLHTFHRNGRLTTYQPDSRLHAVDYGTDAD